MVKLDRPIPADVAVLVDRLLAGARAVLAERFVGFYLHGSLAIGDFDPARSDVDFLVAVRDQLSTAEVVRMAALHAAIAASDLRWATNYEGSYIPLAALRRHDPANARHWAVRVDGSLDRDRHGSEWVIQRYVIREHGVVVAGPSPATLIDPITPARLKDAVCALLHEWWEPQLTDPFRLADSEYQAYAVLTMCRALYTLRHGTVVSKPVAAEWALTALPSEWRPVVIAARQWRHGAELQITDAALALIRHTLAVAAEID